MLAPAARSSSTLAGHVTQIQPSTAPIPFMAVGLGTDVTFGAIEIGASYGIVASSRTAVNSTAAPASSRQRGPASRPVGKSSRKKRNAPAGKTRSTIQLETRAAN